MEPTTATQPQSSLEQIRRLQQAQQQMIGQAPLNPRALPFNPVPPMVYPAPLMYSPPVWNYSPMFPMMMPCYFPNVAQTATGPHIAQHQHQQLMMTTTMNPQLNRAEKEGDHNNNGCNASDSGTTLTAPLSSKKGVKPKKMKKTVGCDDDDPKRGIEEDKEEEEIVEEEDDDDDDGGGRRAVKGDKNWIPFTSIKRLQRKKKPKKRYLHRPWTEEEDAMLLKCMNDYGNKWTVIETMIPNRGKYECRDRWRIMEKKKSSSSTLEDDAE